MNNRQTQFVAEYLVDLNATQAAIRAGFSEKTARSQGQRLLTNVDIAAAIGVAQSLRSARTEINADYVVTNLTEITERCMQRAPVMEFDREKKCHVQATDARGNNIWTFDARGAVGALTLLAKHTGGFADRHELTGKDGGPIEVVDADELRKRLGSRITGITSRIGTNGDNRQLNGNGARHS